MSGYESNTIRIDDEPTGLCAVIQDLLPFYLDGDVSPQSRRFVDDHLGGCRACSAFLAGGRSVRTHLRREHAVRATPAESYDGAHRAIARGRRQVVLLSLATVSFVVLLLALALLASGSSRSMPAMAPERARATMGEPTAVGPTPTPVPGQP